MPGKEVGNPSRTWGSRGRDSLMGKASEARSERWWAGMKRQGASPQPMVCLLWAWEHREVASPHLSPQENIARSESLPVTTRMEKDGHDPKRQL